MCLQKDDGIINKRHTPRHYFLSYGYTYNDFVSLVASCSNQKTLYYYYSMFVSDSSGSLDIHSKRSDPWGVTSVTKRVNIHSIFKELQRQAPCWHMNSAICFKCTYIYTAYFLIFFFPPVQYLFGYVSIVIKSCATFDSSAMNYGHIDIKSPFDTSIQGPMDIFFFFFFL